MDGNGAWGAANQDTEHVKNAVSVVLSTGMLGFCEGAGAIIFPENFVTERLQTFQNEIFSKKNLVPVLIRKKQKSTMTIRCGLFREQGYQVREQRCSEKRKDDRHDI